MSEISHIDCGYLALTQAMAEERWTDPKLKDNYIADVEVAKAVMENQQVNLVELKDPGKDKTISLEWREKCEIETDECSDDCTITGDDVEPLCKEYSIECLQETSFVVPERAYRDRTIEKQTAIAENMLLHKRAMDNYIAGYILAGIDANTGVNAFTGAPGNVVGNLTYILGNYWNEYIFGYFQRVIRGNKFRNPYMVDGDNMFQLIWNILNDKVNSNGAGAANKLQNFIQRIYQDPENIEGDPDYAHKTYLLHKTAAAFVTKTYYPNGAANAIQKEGGKYLLWSEESMNLPGVWYDVIYKNECSSNEFYDKFKLQLHGLFAVNPYPCDRNNTGILSFDCGAPD
jgi:hypothetical protein